MVAVSALLTGLAVLLLVPPSGARRLGRAVGLGERSSAGPGVPASGARRAGPWGLPPPVLACALAGAAAALLLPLPIGIVVGAALSVLGPRLLDRLEPRSVRAERQRLLADLPLLLDLLASCLAGGAALPAAARAVGAAVPGPGGRRLQAVAALLAVGAPPQEAWSALSGGAPDDPLAPAARALARASDGGAPVAAAVARMAVEARADARSVAEQAARRVGVHVVAPLGLCFLPAFVLLSVVPVVAGLAGPLLAGT